MITIGGFSLILVILNKSNRIADTIRNFFSLLVPNLKCMHVMKTCSCTMNKRKTTIE